MGKSPGYNLPGYAAVALKDLPWSMAAPLPVMNSYIGLVQDSFHRFTHPALRGDVYLYESKFAMDADGIDPREPGDTFQPDTALHLKNEALSSLHYPYAVIPLARRGQDLMSFDRLGIKLSDVGVAFYGSRRQGYAYGDKGPTGALLGNIGEGSRYVARKLGIPSSPVDGGIDITEIPPGVVHLCFAGTGDADPEDPITQFSAADVERVSNTYLALFMTP